MIIQKMISVNMFSCKYTLFQGNLQANCTLKQKKQQAVPFDKECLLLFVASVWLASPDDITCRSRLLSVVLVRYCQLLAAMCAARSQYATTILGSHTLTETMLVHATTIVRLKCSWIVIMPYCFC